MPLFFYAINKYATITIRNIAEVIRENQLNTSF